MNIKECHEHLGMLGFHIANFGQERLADGRHWHYREYCLRQGGHTINCKVYVCDDFFTAWDGHVRLANRMSVNAAMDEMAISRVLEYCV